MPSITLNTYLYDDGAFVTDENGDMIIRIQSGIIDMPLSPADWGLKRRSTDSD